MNVKDIALPLPLTLHEHYQLQEIVYWGHTGIIYLAEDLVNEMPVAIKEFCPFSFVNRDLDGKNVIYKSNTCKEYYETGMNNFRQECEIVKRVSLLENPYKGCTLQYIEDFEENGTIYLVTELVHGVNFEEFIKEKSVNNAKKCMIDLLEIVKQVHKLGILHRDIKPANILVRDDGKPILIDFGSACFREDSSLPAQFISRGYSAPEMYSGQYTDKRTDIYSLGAILYFAYSGYRLPDASEVSEEEPIPPISELCDVSPELEKIIMKSIEQNIDLRVADIDQLESVLYE